MITEKPYSLNTYIPHMPEYIPLRCNLYATSEYILVLGYSSANILYNDYAEEYSDTY